jgi:agmatine/peptidylarginine deiminase
MLSLPKKITAVFKEYLGINNVIWLGDGIVGGMTMHKYYLMTYVVL